MIAWITHNIGTLLIGFLVFAVSLLAVRSVYHTKKKGGCLGGCAGCSGTCHQTEK